MTPKQILERERRWALPAGLTALGLVVVSIIASLIGTDLPDPDDELLTEFRAERSSLLISALIQGLALTAGAAPLAYLFKAAAARSPRMRSALLGVTIAGPVFLGAAAIVQWIGLDNAAGEFAGLGACDEECAEDLIDDQGILSLSQGLSLAGLIGLVFGIFYTSRYLLRTGLMSRFWGTLAMALGVTWPLLGIQVLSVFFIAAGLLILGLWPRGRPPAWETGEAMPWPKPGEARQASDREGDDGDGDEVGLPEGFGETEAGSAAEGDEGERPAEPEEAGAGPRKRKRKRRG